MEIVAISITTDVIVVEIIAVVQAAFHVRLVRSAKTNNTNVKE
ncbi:hypothetical protein ACYVOU_002336 [Vibrio cholerae]